MLREGYCSASVRTFSSSACASDSRHALASASLNPGSVLLVANDAQPASQPPPISTTIAVHSEIDSAGTRAKSNQCVTRMLMIGASYKSNGPVPRSFRVVGPRGRCGLPSTAALSTCTRYAVVPEPPKPTQHGDAVLRRTNQQGSVQDVPLRGPVRFSRAPTDSACRADPGSPQHHPACRVHP